MTLISIVHEFSVLYSSRVFQKDKKWCDGRLRFYELNNKLEVLSDDMLLVETDFYPHQARSPLESGAFEEGNEYIFPSGKLVVAINQYLGLFERDISSVFSKKDPAAKIELAIQYEQQNSTNRQTLDKPKLKGGEIPCSRVLEQQGMQKQLISQRKIPQVGRPLGLPRTPKRVEKQSPIKGAFKIDVAAKLDSLPVLLVRQNRRIPPGSNKLSTRLRLELEPFLVTEDGKIEDEFTGSTDCLLNSTTAEEPEILDDGLDEILSVTQRYLS